MAKQNAKAAASELQNLFDPRGYRDIFTTWTGTNQRLATIAVTAGTRSTGIASDAARESLSNLRDVTRVRDEAADYGKAYADFVQKQIDLFMRSAQAFGDITQQAGNETGEVASKAGGELTDRLSSTVEGVADKAGSAARKAA